MGRPRQKLDKQQQAKALEGRLRLEPPGWRRERLLAVQMGLAGELNLEEIAAAVGHARSTVQQWFDRFRDGGLARLLEDQRAQNHGPAGLLAEPEQARFAAELAQGRWRTAPQMQRWLAEELGLQAAVTTIYGWLGKAGARLRVPRPSHVKKDPAAAEAFKENLLPELRALALPIGTALRRWALDEMRFGLHSFSRRVWVTGPQRPVCPSQQKYQWGYLYGAVGVGHARREFFLAETVDQDHLSASYRQIAQSDPGVTHILLQDGAGFHLRAGDPRLPANVRIITLPPYSPELNPVEKLWDQIKDELCNRAFATLAELQQTITAWLQRFWADLRRAFTLIGDGWLLDRANASAASLLPGI